MLNRIFAAITATFTACAAPIACHAACVHDTAEFQQALDNASGATTPSDIRVASGTYGVGASSLHFVSAVVGQGAIAIEGGYNNTCTTQTMDASLTVLDGQNTASTLGVLHLQSSGAISVRYLTIESGSTASATYPAGLVAIRSGGSGDVVVEYNIIRANSAQYFGGFTASIGDDLATAGDVHFDGNLVYGNTASTGSGGAGLLTNATSGWIYATNNTVADNVVTAEQGANMGGLEIESPATLSNNIAWGNTKADVNISGLHAGSVVLVDDDFGVVYGTPDPASSGNLSVDPLFLALGDYHLSVYSPLHGQGTFTPAAGLPGNDIEGNPRSYAGKVDLGAYESEKIFADGFD